MGFEQFLPYLQKLGKIKPITDPEELLRTPGINPNAEQPAKPLSLANVTLPKPSSVGNVALPKPVNDPATPTPNPVGRLNVRPSDEPIPAPSNPRIPSGLVGMKPDRQVDPQGNTGRANVQANKPFNPVDYSNDPIGRAERDYVTSRAHEKRSGWAKVGDALKVGLIGMNSVRPNATWQERLGAFGLGTAAGGVVGKISPMGMSSMLFNQFVRPNEEDKINRERESEMYGLKRRGEIGGLRVKAAQEENYLNEINNRNTDNERQRQLDAYSKEQDALKLQLEKDKLNKPPTHFSQVIGEDGKPYWRNVADPANAGLPAYVAPDKTADDVINVPGLGLVKKRGGQVVREVSGDSDTQINAVNRDIEGYNKLQASVVELGNRIQGTSPDDPDYRALSGEYNAKRQQLQAESDRLKATHGGNIEDVGQGGWSYFRPKVQRRGAAANGGSGGGVKAFPASEVANFAAAQGIDEAEAKRRIQASGYTIR